MVKAIVATQEHFDQLNADLREKDLAECRVFGCEGEDMKNWEYAWALFVDDDLVGIVGWGLFANATPLSKERFFMFMTTNKVWKHKLTFVKYSRKVAEFVMAQLPPWVEHIHSLPMSSYAESVKWQTKVLGFHYNGEIELNGVKHTRLYKHRSEV